MDRWLTVPEAAGLLSVHRQTAYRMVWAGLLPWHDVALPGARRPRIRISAAALTAYMRANERTVS